MFLTFELIVSYVLIKKMYIVFIMFVLLLGILVFFFFSLRIKVFAFVLPVGYPRTSGGRVRTR